MENIGAQAVREYESMHHYAITKLLEDEGDTFAKMKIFEGTSKTGEERFGEHKGKTPSYAKFIDDDRSEAIVI